MPRRVRYVEALDRLLHLLVGRLSCQVHLGEDLVLEPLPRVGHGVHAGWDRGKDVLNLLVELLITASATCFWSVILTPSTMMVEGALSWDQFTQSLANFHSCCESL